MSKSEFKPSESVVYLYVKWYAYFIAASFVLYGGVKIVLGVMDNNRDGFATYLIYVVVGSLLASVAVAFRDRKNFGWYGLVGANGLIIISELFHLQNTEGIVLFLLSGLALVGLFMPQTRESIFSH